MKTPLFLFPRFAALGLALTATCAVLPVATLSLLPAPARAAEAAQGEVTFDFFYNNLGEQGDWYNTPDFGYVWQPYIAYQNGQWRPYTDGYWAQTDQGWTWVSYEDFGWAAYHYGRWTQLEKVGWVWVPGYEWGPGWVSWRSGEEYVGWAPLPPKSERRVGYISRVDSSSREEEPAPHPAPRPRPEGGRIARYEDYEDDLEQGYNASVDVAYDIGPAQYCFVPVASFGAPYVREFVVPPVQNVTIIERTVNVTNISYRRGHRGDNRIVYAGGPDFDFISRRAERPVPRLLLERRTDVAFDRGALRADQFNVIRDNRLEVVAPIVSRREFNFADVRPGRVKENLERPQVIHGWRSVQAQDPRLVERLRNQFRQQAQQAQPARVVAERFVTPTDFRAQPPPSVQQQQQQAVARQVNQVPPAPPAGGPGASNAANLPPAPAPANPAAAQPVPGPRGKALTEADRAARRDARMREMQDRQRGRGVNVPPAAIAPGQPPATPAPANNGNRTPEEREARRAARQQERAPQPPAVTPPAPAPQPQPPASPPPDAQRSREERHAARQPPPDAQRSREERRAARQQARETQPAQPQPPPAADPGAAEAQAREQRRAERQAARQAAPAAQAPAQQESANREREARRAARQQEQQPQRAAAEQQAGRAREEQQQRRAAERAQQQQQPQPSQAAEQQRAAAREERQRAAAEQRAQQARGAQQTQQQQVQQPRAEGAARGGDAQQDAAREQRRAAKQAAPPPAAPNANPQPAEEPRKKHKDG